MADEVSVSARGKMVRVLSQQLEVCKNKVNIDLQIQPKNILPIG